MHEYMSLKVSSTEHADLATQLTTLSTQGWNVVNIVSTGVDLIAYLSRSQTASITSQSTADVSVGWAAVGTQSATPPPASATQITPAVPADWYPDPSRRFEFRYWDGMKWTDNVARAGVTYKDPPVP